jgi:hypothetical protein
MPAQNRAADRRRVIEAGEDLTALDDGFAELSTNIVRGTSADAKPPLTCARREG